MRKWPPLRLSEPLTINAPTFQSWSTVTVPSMVQSVFGPHVVASSEERLLPVTETSFRVTRPFSLHCETSAGGSGAV